MNTPGKTYTAIMRMLTGALLVAMMGCGGGGNTPPVSSAPSSADSGGMGRLAASVKFTPPAAGRTAEAASSLVNVSITVTGVYSLDDQEFPPVTSNMTIDMSQGPATVQILSVPTGKHHLFTATADWGGATQTIKAIIPGFAKDELVTFTADQSTTVIADTALYVAEQQSKRLADLNSSDISPIASAVSAMSLKGISYAAMTPESVLEFISRTGVPAAIAITPATATVMAGQTYQFTASLTDLNGTGITGAVFDWAFSSSAIGGVNSAGLFTASISGTGVVTASTGTLSATASVAVVSTCEIDSQCEDGAPLTIDTCQNPGSSSATCVHTAIACNTNSDCASGAPYCINGETLTALCAACVADTDCNDNNALTVDVCSNASTASASCGHTAIACAVDLDCDDSNVLTQDLCANGGAISASCSHPLDTTLTPQFLDSITIGSGSYNDLIYSMLSSKLMAVDTSSRNIMTYNFLNQTDSSISLVPDEIYRLVKDPARDAAYAISVESSWTTFSLNKIDISSETIASSIPISSGNYSYYYGYGEYGSGSGYGPRVAGRKQQRNEKIAARKAGRTSGARKAAKTTAGRKTRRQAAVGYSYAYSRPQWGAPTEWHPEISATRDELFVPNIDMVSYNTQVAIIDLSSFTEAAYIDTGSYSYYDYYYAGVPIDETAQIMYSVNDYTTLNRLDLAARSPLTSSALTWDGDIYRMAERRVAGVPYLYAVTSNSVLEIYNMNTESLVCAVPGTSGGPLDHATIGIYDPLNHVYVNDGVNVSVFNGTDCSLITTIAGEYPMFGFAYDGALGRVYLSHGTNVITALQYAPPPGP